MRSYQIVDWGAPLEARDYPTPEPKGREVLLRVAACGMCHSDLHIWQGYFDLGGGKRLSIADRGVELPFTLGHEVVGEVAALGPETEGVAVGDKRVVYPWIGCGECEVCRRGDELLCLKPRIVGTWRNGGYSDYVIVPDARYLVDYSGIATELACTYACSGITAYSALKKAGAEHPEDDIVIIGAGGVGLNALHFAPTVVNGRVIVADTDAVKRSAARQSGASDTVDNGQPDAVAKVRELTAGGAAAAIDFVGAPATTQFGIDVLRKGGTLVTVGLYGDALSLPLPLLPLRMLTLRGSYVGTLQDLKDVIELAQSGKVPPIPLDRRAMADANQALDDLRNGKVLGRVVMTP